MNIFATFDCPIKSARYLDNKRVIKMILESAQMLSTAINFYGGKAPYKSTHINHPCSVWVRESRVNYIWLLRHFIALSQEYTKRYGKIHKSSQYTEFFKENELSIPNGIPTPFPNCTTLKHVGNTHLAYRLYLNKKWKNDKIKPICNINL